MPNPAQYKAKLVACTEGKDPLALQSNAPGIAAELIARVPEQALRLRPFPDKWSVGRSSPISRRTNRSAVGGIGR